MRLRSPLVGEEEKSWSWCNSAKPWIFQVRGKFPVPNPTLLSCKIYDLADAKLMILLSPPPRGRGCAQRHSSKSSRYFIHTPISVCHHACTPAAGWIANASVQAGGRPFGICGNVRQLAEGGGGHRSSAGGRFLLEDRAKPATGPGFASCQPQGWMYDETLVRACGGHERLTVAGQGPCRTPENHSRSLSRLRPEQSGRG